MFMFFRYLNCYFIYHFDGAKLQKNIHTDNFFLPPTKKCVFLHRQNSRGTQRFLDLTPLKSNKMNLLKRQQRLISR